MPGIVEWNVMGYVFMEYTENDMMNAYIAAAKEPDTGDATIYVNIAWRSLHLACRVGRVKAQEPREINRYR